MSGERKFAKIAGRGIAICAVVGLASCVSEMPFPKDPGVLSLSVALNEDVKTRAGISGERAQELGEKCVIYISDAEGLRYRYVGVSNIPEEIPLESGSYVGEAWTGDSVSASWDKKFYRCYEKFEVSPRQTTKLELSCNIANVVARVDASGVTESQLPDFKVTVGHSCGSLEFNAAEVRAENNPSGYFMMSEPDRDLKYTIEGTNAHGEKFTLSDIIANVKPATEYTIKMKANAGGGIVVGGAPISIEIDEREIVVTQKHVFYEAPSVTCEGQDLSLPIPFSAGNVVDPMAIQIIAYKGIKSCVLIFDNDAEWHVPTRECDFVTMSADALSEFEQAGLKWESSYADATGYGRATLTLSPQLLNALSSGTHQVAIHVEDHNGQIRDRVITLTSDKASVAVPGSIEGLLDIRASSANLMIKTQDEAVTNPGIEYREKGSSSWTRVGASVRSRAGGEYVAHLTGLKPATEYEYRAVADGFTQSSLSTFTTEGTYSIPNSSFEEWDTYQASTMLGTKTVTFPGSGSKSFWDSGNEGAATANMTLTDKSTDMKHSGQYSARLGSASALGMLAAGNIFAGLYVRTDGTNGVLSFGRPYNGSHPSKLAVWANYRPGNVDIMKDSSVPIVSGQPDHGQIYVALVTSPIEIRTKESNRKLFNPNDPEVLAYGEVTWTSDFGPDGALQKVEIPLTYYKSAQTQSPAYLVIVVSASKYGDYFSGSSSSVMYLDDFELIYE